MSRAAEGLERREYQLRIAEAASKANTLVVLPTGLGKTIIAILVAERRLTLVSCSGEVLAEACLRPAGHYND